MKNQAIIEVGGKCDEVMVSMYPNIYGNKPDKGKLYLKLERALYGTTEAAKIWFDTLTEMLVTNGFKVCSRDPCVLMYGKQLTICMHGRSHDRKSRSQGC